MSLVAPFAAVRGTAFRHRRSTIDIDPRETVNFIDVAPLERIA